MVEKNLHSGGSGKPNEDLNFVAEELAISAMKENLLSLKCRKGEVTRITQRQIFKMGNQVGYMWAEEVMDLKDGLYTKIFSLKAEMVSPNKVFKELFRIDTTGIVDHQKVSVENIAKLRELRYCLQFLYEKLPDYVAMD